MKYAKDRAIILKVMGMHMLIITLIISNLVSHTHVWLHHKQYASTICVKSIQHGTILTQIDSSHNLNRTKLNVDLLF